MKVMIAVFFVFAAAFGAQPTTASKEASISDLQIDLIIKSHQALKSKDLPRSKQESASAEKLNSKPESV